MWDLGYAMVWYMVYGKWRGKSGLQLAILSGRLGNFVAIGHYRNF